MNGKLPAPLVTQPLSPALPDTVSSTHYVKLTLWTVTALQQGTQIPKAASTAKEPSKVTDEGLYHQPMAEPREETTHVALAKALLPSLHEQNTTKKQN